MPFVQAGDVRLHYTERGSGPEPLVFVHGFTSSCRAWQEIQDLLPDRYRAIFIDLRGAGESDKPDGAYGPAVYADDLNVATRELGLDTFTLIGHSMGGVTGMQFAVTHPERLRKLVLVAPAPAGGLTNVDPAFRAQMKAVRHNRDVRRKMAHAFAVRPTPDSTIERRIDDDLKWTEQAYDGAWQAMADLRIEDDVARIETPTLMIVGDRDALRAANLADAQRIPNCALHVFYRVGHEIQSDVPAEFVALLDDFIHHGVGETLSMQARREMLQNVLRQPAASG
jgi:pimeloyl-ACP methyl ester carboxylesterase